MAKRRVSFGQDTIKLIPHNDDLRTLFLALAHQIKAAVLYAFRAVSYAVEAVCYATSQMRAPNHLKWT